MALDPSSIFKTLLPSDIQKTQAEISALQIGNKTNQLLQPQQVQAAQLANQQTAAMNPLNVQKAQQENQAKQIENQSGKLTIAAQIASGITDQPSLDAAHASLQALDIDGQAHLPTTWDAQTGPAAAQSAYQKALMYKGQLLQMQKLGLDATGIHNSAVGAQTGAQGTAPTVSADGLTLQAPGATLSNPGQGQTAPPPAPVTSSPLSPQAPAGGVGIQMPALTPGATSALLQTDQQPDQPNIAPAYLAATGVQPASDALATANNAKLTGDALASSVNQTLSGIQNSKTLSQDGKKTAADLYMHGDDYQRYLTQLGGERQQENTIQTGAGADFNKMKTDNDTAGPAIATIQQAMSEAQQFPSGTGANARLATGKVVQSIAQSLGIKTDSLAEQNGSQEAFNKAMLQMTMGSLQQTGEKSNAAMSAFQSGLPSALTTKNGLQQVTSGLIGNQQFKQAQFTAANAINAAGGSVKNFNFQDKISPMAFVYNNMTPANQIIFAHNLFKQPNGPSELKNLAKQMQWAGDQPWGPQFNFIQKKVAQ